MTWLTFGPPFALGTLFLEKRGGLWSNICFALVPDPRRAASHYLTARGFFSMVPVCAGRVVTSSRSLLIHEQIWLTYQLTVHSKRVILILIGGCFKMILINRFNRILQIKCFSQFNITF